MSIGKKINKTVEIMENYDEAGNDIEKALLTSQIMCEWKEGEYKNKQENRKNDNNQNVFNF